MHCLCLAARWNAGRSLGWLNCKLRQVRSRLRVISQAQKLVFSCLIAPEAHSAAGTVFPLWEQWLCGQRIHTLTHSLYMGRAKNFSIIEIRRVSSLLVQIWFFTEGKILLVLYTHFLFYNPCPQFILPLSVFLRSYSRWCCSGQGGGVITSSCQQLVSFTGRLFGCLIIRLKM